MATKGPQLNPSPKCMDFCELLLQVTQKQKGPKADSLRFKQIVRQTMSLGDTYNDSITDVLGNHVMVKPLNVTIYSLYFAHFHIFIPLEKIHQKYDALCYLQCVCVGGGADASAARVEADQIVQLCSLASFSTTGFQAYGLYPIIPSCGRSLLQKHFLLS